jgi:hypothetical protein
LIYVKKRGISLQAGQANAEPISPSKPKPGLNHCTAAPPEAVLDEFPLFVRFKKPYLN